MILSQLMPISAHGFIVRKLRIQDADSLAEIEISPEVKRFLAEPECDRQQWLAKFNPNTFGAFGIEVENQLAGRVSLYPYRAGRKGYGEVAIVLGKKFWNKGIATKVLALICETAFIQLKLRGLVAIVHPDNGASAKLLRSAGFKRRGIITAQDPTWQTGHIIYRRPRRDA